MDWTDLLVAAGPPLVLWLLWRIQSIAVNGALRGGMYKLLRYQRRTYAVVSWFGVLLHEISHAVLLLLGGHGIKGFNVNVDSGHVVPRQVRKGWYGTLTFIAAALAPAYAAPLAVFLVLVLAPGAAWTPSVAAATGWPALSSAFTGTLLGIPPLLLWEVVGLDVATVLGGALFGLAVFAMPSARPSFVKVQGGKDEGDIAAVRNTIRRRPVPVLVAVGLAYASYFVVTPFFPAAYWSIWQGAWTVSMLATTLAILMGVVWYGVAWAGQIRPALAWMPFALVLAVQVAGRMLDQAMSLVNLATLTAFIAATLLLRSIATRRY